MKTQTLGQLVSVGLILFVASRGAAQPPSGSSSLRVSLLANLKGHGDSVTGAAISPDGSRLASTSIDRSVRIWKLPDGELERTLHGHLGFTWRVAFTPDGKRLISSGDDPTAVVWDLDTGTPAQILSGHLGAVQATTPLLQGQMISAGDDRWIRRWDLQTGRVTKAWRQDEAPGRMALCVGGDRLTSITADGRLQIWDATTIDRLKEFGSHDANVQGLAASPVKPLVATGGWDGRIRIWDIDRGELVATLSGHTDRVIDLAFSTDGAWLVSGSGDKTAIVWDVASAAPLATLSGHEHWVHGVAISPDSSLVATAGWDKVIKLWRLETEVGASP